MFLFLNLNPINSYQYSFFIKMKFVFQEIHKDPKHLQVWKIYRRFSHDCYVQIEIQNLSAEVSLQFYIAFYTATSKHFCIYYHLPLACFCITPSQPIQGQEFQKSLCWRGEGGQKFLLIGWLIVGRGDNFVRGC